MVTLSHMNFTLHRLLTDEGAFIHEHFPDSFEDIGDAESGPELTGGPSFDQYSGESHRIIVDASGLIVHSEEIDWSFEAWSDHMEMLYLIHHSDGQEPPEDYVRPRKTGEDWQISIRDEDGRWWRHRGGGWCSSREEAGFFSISQAGQIAATANAKHQPDWLRSGAKVVHADECPRCLARRIPDSDRSCTLCGKPYAALGVKKS